MARRHPRSPGWFGVLVSANPGGPETVRQNECCLKRMLYMAPQMEPGLIL